MENIKIFSKNKVNLIFFASILLFVFACFNYSAGYEKLSAMTSTNQVGGRFGVIIPAFSCGCGTPATPQPPCPHLCVCGTHDVTIIPSGLSAPAMCPPVAMPVRTGIPPSSESTGKAVLGFCETLIPTAACSNFGTSYR